MAEERMLNDEILLGLIKANSGGGGGGGTDDYNDLKNQPKIENVTLKGNKTAEDLGLATAAALADKVDKVDGKGLSTNDFTDAYKTAIGDNATAISGIKNGESINSFGGVESALALKQNATDNSLDTEAKTIVGAINENAGDIGSLKSGFTNLDTEVNGDAVTYPYADVITINDAVPANLANCSVKIEPVQDLHGYDHPWVGGAGKNKCNPTGSSTTYSDYSVTKNDDGSFTVTGGGTSGQVIAIPLGEFKAKANTEYTLNGCPTGGGSGTYRLDVRSNSSTIYKNVTDSGSGFTFTADEDATLYVYARFGTSYAITGSVTFYPMLRLATETDATFAPYTNICPISGHTEAVVTRNGINQWDEVLEPGSINMTTGENESSAEGRWRSKNYNPIVPGTTYYLATTESRVGLYYYDINKQFIDRGSVNKNTTFTTPNNCYFIRFRTLANYGDAYKNNISINYPSTDTEYHPYSGQQYTLALGSTIYGGTVDFETGVMKVDRKYVAPTSDAEIESNSTLLPSDTWLVKVNDGKEAGRIISNMYDNSIPTSSPGNCRITSSGKIRVKTYQAYSSAADAYSGAFDGSQFCYELATPTIIQLTPQQIQLLQGTNTLYASTGDISVTVNGVSGAIGAVQEQVNGLAEDVAEIKPLDYSTTEQKTGQKWIDGKDIYVKTFNAGALPSSGNVTVQNDIGDFGAVINVETVGISNDGYSFSNDGLVMSYANSTSLVFRVTFDATGYNGYVTVYYIKTT